MKFPMRTAHLLGLLLFTACGKVPATLQPNEKLQLPVGKPPQGVDVGSGGDSYAAQFVAIGYDILGMLKEEPVSSVTSAQFENALKTTKVVSTQRELIIDGVTKDALNHPEWIPPTIEVNRARWDVLEKKYEEEYFLVFHEYLGILGITDSQYQVSTSLDRTKIDRARVCPRTLVIRKELESQTRKSCYRITSDDLRSIHDLNLSGKGLQELKVGDFDFLSSLRLLDLSNNRLQTLPPWIFRDLTNLRILRLGSNQVLALSENLFQGLTNLESIEASRSSIRKLMSWMRKANRCQSGLLESSTLEACK